MADTTESKLPVSYLSVNGESREIVDAAARKDIDALEALTEGATNSSIYNTEGNFGNIDNRLENIEGILRGLQINEEKNFKSEIKSKSFNSVDDRFEDIEAEIVNARTSIDSSTYSNVGTRIGTIETEIVEARKSDKEEKTYDTLGTRIKTIEEDVSDINKTYYLRPLFYETGSFDKNELNFSKDGNDNYKILLKDKDSNSIEIEITESDLLDKYQEEMGVTVSAAIFNGDNEILIEEINDIATTVKKENGKITSLTVSFTGKISASVYENDIDFSGSSTLYLWYAVWQGLESLELAQARTSCFDFEKKDNLRQRLNTDFDYAANAIKVDKENKQLTVQPGTSGGAKDQTIWQWMSDNYNTSGTIDTTDKTVGAAIWNWLTNNYANYKSNDDGNFIINADITEKTVGAAIWNWLHTNEKTLVNSAFQDWFNDQDSLSDAEIVELLSNGEALKNIVGTWLTENYANYKSNDEGNFIINADITEKTVGAAIWNWLTENYDLSDSTNDVVGAIWGWLSENYDLSDSTNDVVGAIWNWLRNNYATNGTIDTTKKTVGAAIVNWLKTEEGTTFLANSMPCVSPEQDGFMTSADFEILNKLDDLYNTLASDVKKNVWSSENLTCAIDTDNDTNDTVYKKSNNGTWVTTNIYEGTMNVKGVYQGTATDKILFLGPCSFHVTNIAENGFYGKIKNYNLVSGDSIQYTIYANITGHPNTTLYLENVNNDIEIHIDTSIDLVGDWDDSKARYPYNLYWDYPFVIPVKPVSTT